MHMCQRLYVGYMCVSVACTCVSVHVGMSVYRCERGLCAYMSGLYVWEGLYECVDCECVRLYVCKCM